MSKLDTFAQTARDEIGNGEDKNGKTKYGIWYGDPTGSWCVMFISWCANEAGILTTSATSDPPNFKKASTVTDLRTYFVNSHRDLTPSSNSASPNYPKVGDIAVIDNSAGTYAHAGIVVETNGNKITLVEGNTSNKVTKVTYTDLKASGYGTISLLLSNNTHY